MSPAWEPLSRRLARIARQAAERKFRDHLIDCADCSQAFKRRRDAKYCSFGARLLADWKACQADYDEQARLDKLPNPDQEALFEAAEVMLSGGADG
jgi:hypothetical protein